MKKTKIVLLILLIAITKHCFSLVTYEAFKLGTVIDQVGYLGALNNKGQVIGTNNVSGKKHAVIWNSRSGSLTDINLNIGGISSIGYRINDSGQVIGKYTKQSGELRNFFWDEKLGVFDLPYNNMRLGNNGYVLADNRYLWNVDGTVIDLRDRISNMTHASSVNSNGTVVGQYKTEYNITHGFIWSEAEGLKDVSSPSGLDFWVYEINDNSQVIGEYIDPLKSTYEFPYSVSFLWGEDMGVLSIDGIHSNGLNDLGQLVGVTVGGGSGILWDKNNGLSYLNDLISDSDVSVRNGLEINNAGQILAIEGDGNGLYLLTPQTDQSVPEPATMILFGFGILGMFKVSQKRKL